MHGSALADVPAWNENEVVVLPHDLSGLLQGFVNSKWDDQYNWPFGYLVSRHYEYKEGDYFGLACGTDGGLHKIAYQDPANLDEEPDYPGYGATLSVDWATREYYEATYYMKEYPENPQEDTYTEGTENRFSETDPLLRVGSGNKGYWRFCISVPKYAVIQSAAIYKTAGEDVTLMNPVFHALYPNDDKWHGSGGFRDIIERDVTGVVPDLNHYPDAASLQTIARSGTVEYSGACLLGSEVSGGIDITRVAQSWVDHGDYEVANYVGLVLESATNAVEIEKGSLSVKIEWMLIP
jgi:hypothetical protein